MKLNIKKIEQKLTTNFMCKKIIYKENLDSTQNEAKRLLKEGNIQNGTYIVTDNQTKGRGTNGRSWYSSKYQNICGTLILTPYCHIKKIENLTTLIADCIIKSIKNLYNIELNIKYPNDIMCKGKKICGILTESSTNKEIVKYIFIGIGINANQTNFNIQISEIATSLKIELGKDIEREDLIVEIFNSFEKEYLNSVFRDTFKKQKNLNFAKFSCFLKVSQKTVGNFYKI